MHASLMSMHGAELYLSSSWPPCTGRHKLQIQAVVALRAY
jgi:hypothetical protein